MKKLKQKPQHNDGDVAYNLEWQLAVFMCLGRNKVSCAEPCNTCLSDAKQVIANGTYLEIADAEQK